MKKIAYWVVSLGVILGTSIGWGSAQGLEQSSGDSAAVLQQGQELTQLFYEGKTDVIWGRFNKSMKQAMGNVEALKTFQQGIERDLGGEASVDSETVQVVGEVLVYLRTVRFEKNSGISTVQWAFDASGKVAGFFVRPANGGNVGS